MTETQNNHDTGILECPDCGYKSFSFVAEIIQSGDVQQSEDGTRSVHAHEIENVIGDDIDEEGVHCRGCNNAYDLDELVLA